MVGNSCALVVKRSQKYSANALRPFVSPNAFSLVDEGFGGPPSTVFFFCNNPPSHSPPAIPLCRGLVEDVGKHIAVVVEWAGVGGGRHV